MELPRTIPPETAAAIASYDYTDIAEGTGVVIFQGFNTKASGAITWHLGTTDIYSADIETASNADSYEYDFDTAPFNLPKTIKGTAKVRFSTYFLAAMGNVTTVYVTLQKVELDSNVVDIGTVIATAILYNERAKSRVLTMDLTQTHFKIGETLRLNIKINRVRTDSAEVILAHDPANRDGVWVSGAAVYPTKLEVYVPFKLDV